MSTNIQILNWLSGILSAAFSCKVTYDWQPAFTRDDIMFFRLFVPETELTNAFNLSITPEKIRDMETSNKSLESFLNALYKKHSKETKKGGK